MFKLKSVALAISAITLVNPAQADNPKFKPLPEVEIIEQRFAIEDRKQSDIQILSYSEEEVERYGDATVGDVLRRLPGTTFTGPAGVTKDIRIRGLDKGNTLFLINGEVVPGLTQDRQFQVDRLPADMIERIEVIRSPSAEYDSAAIGGVINIVLKESVQDLTRFRAALGKNGTLNVGDAIVQWSKKFENVSAFIGLSHTVGAEDITEEKEKLNATGDVTERERKGRPTEKSETLFTPRLVFDVLDGKLTFDSFFSDGVEKKDEFSVVTDANSAVKKSSDNFERKTDALGRLGLRFDRDETWGTWFTKFGLQEGQGDKDKAGTELNQAGVVSKRSIEQEKLEEASHYLGGGFGVQVGTHLLKTGVEYREVDYSKNKRTLEANNATNPLAPKATGPNDIYSINENKSILYLQDVWQLHKQHTLTYGARYEEIDRVGVDATGFSRTSDQSSLNPSVHYKWAFNKKTNVRASVSQTLRLPKFDDINPIVSTASGGGAGSLTNPDKGGNPDLRPEEAIGLDFGVERFIANDKGVWGVNAYLRKVDDFIQKSTNLEGTRFVERPFNVGRAEFYGVELDWRVPLKKKGPHEIYLTGNHSELRGSVEDTLGAEAGDVTDLPPRVTNVGVSWLHKLTKWSAGFNVNHVPKFTTDSKNPNGERELKSRDNSTLLDFYVGKVVSAKAEFKLIAKNILAVDKDESTTKFRANGSFNTAERKIEESKPTIYLVFESRF